MITKKMSISIMLYIDTLSHWILEKVYNNQLQSKYRGCPTTLVDCFFLSTVTAKGMGPLSWMTDRGSDWNGTRLWDWFDKQSLRASWWGFRWSSWDERIFFLKGSCDDTLAESCVFDFHRCFSSIKQYQSQFCTTLSINLYWRTTWHRPLWCNSGL